MAIALDVGCYWLWKLNQRTHPQLFVASVDEKDSAPFLFLH